MNGKSCLTLSHCVRLLSAADARAVGWGLEDLLPADLPTCFLLFTFSVWCCHHRAHLLQSTATLSTESLKTQTDLLQQTANVRGAESSQALHSLWDIMGFVYMKECTSSEEQSIFF